MDSERQADRFQRFLELSPFIGWIAAPDGAYLDVSPSWTTLTGMNRDDALAGKWTVLVHPSELPALESAWRRSLATGDPLDVEFRLRLASGRYEWMRARAFADVRDGRIALWYGVTENVHETALAQARLRELADAMPQLVWTATPDGKVDYYNARRTAYAAADGDPLQWAPLIHPDDLPRTLEAWTAATAAGEDYACEHRLKCADGEWSWHLSRAIPAKDENGTVVRWYGTATDIDAIKTAEAQRELLVKELDHRLKNTLQIVQALIRQSLRGAENVDDARAAIEERLKALASAHGMLTRRHWGALDLRQLVAEALQSYGEERRTMDGPAVALDPQTAVAFAMALHELATNAVKYGALSVDAGRVAVSWTLDEARLRVEWRERNGPPVTPPTRRGFGTMMLERALASELGGVVSLAFEPTGLVCRIDGRRPGA